METRIGIGYDVHRLVPGRPLIVGGIEIPYDLGLAGHSDADVLVHAICDSLFGAAGMADIGTHFPDSDPRYKGISSLELLFETCRIIAQRGWTVGNIDNTICAQAPKFGPHRDAMRQKLAPIVAIAPDRINIKATTTEGLGAIGAGKGIAAMAVAQILR